MRVSVVATGIDVQSSSATGGQKFAAPAADQKKPFAFVPVPKVEPVKPAIRAAYESAQPVMAAPRPAVEQRAGGAVRIERSMEEQQEQTHSAPMEEAPVQEPVRMREPASAVTEEEMSEFRSDPRRQPADVSPRREHHESPRESTRGFFQRMADVGRALSSRHDDTGRPQAPERVQVVQKTVEVSEKLQKPQDEDQYLDIPAFLRRQAN